MRRVIPAIILTLLGLGALATFKSTPGVPTSQAVTTTTEQPSAPTTGATTSAGAAPPPSSSPPSTTGGPTTSVDGDPVENQYGVVQVRITVQGRTITDITALQMPNDRQRSAYISQQAEPYLRQEALQAQSARINIVSGATFTSDSYAQSLQSALDKARL